MTLALVVGPPNNFNPATALFIELVIAFFKLGGSEKSRLFVVLKQRPLGIETWWLLKEPSDCCSKTETSSNRNLVAPKGAVCLLF